VRFGAAGYVWALLLLSDFNKRFLDSFHERKLKLFISSSNCQQFVSGNGSIAKVPVALFCDRFKDNHYYSEINHK
jgi:hypothetical protein